MANPILPPETADAISSRAVRMQALLDMARLLPIGELQGPGDGEATDNADKMSALLHALQNEVNELHMEVCNG